MYVWERILLLILLPCILFHTSCERLHRLVPRGNVYLSSVLSAPLTSPRTCEALPCYRTLSQRVPARIAANCGIDDRTTKSDNRNCRRRDCEVQIIYTLPDIPGYTTTGFGAFGYAPGRTTTLCGQCEDEKLREPQTSSIGASRNSPTESTKINGDGRERTHEGAGRVR